MKGPCWRKGPSIRCRKTSVWSRSIWGGRVHAYVHNSVSMMLQIDSIDLHYGAAQALRNVSLSAQAGKVTCVLGRNGVGKTSLLDALAGRHAISKGAITFDGE